MWAALDFFHSLARTRRALSRVAARRTKLLEVCCAAKRSEALIEFFFGSLLNMPVHARRRQLLWNMHA
jgi:hypothetical protein